MRVLLLLLVLIITLFQPAAAQEAIYRWTDTEGRTHYGTKPPDNVEAEPVNLDSRPVITSVGESVYKGRTKKVICTTATIRRTRGRQNS